MKRNYQGYVFLAFKKSDPWDWVGIKTNKEGKWLSVFGKKEANLPFTEKLKAFATWIGNVADYRMVAYGHETYHAFFSDMERKFPHIFPRHFIRMMKAQLWNIKSECMYRFKIHQETSLEEFLFLYKQDPVRHSNPLIEECVNLLNLTNLFLFDQKQTRQLIKKPKTEIIEEIYRSYSTEELMELLTEKGYFLSVAKEKDGTCRAFLHKNGEMLKEITGNHFYECLVQLALFVHLWNGENSQQAL